MPLLQIGAATRQDQAGSINAKRRSAVFSQASLSGFFAAALVLFLAIGGEAFADGAPIAAGREHSIFVASDGKVYATGDNRFGQLGLGHTRNRDRFTEASSLKGKKIIAIAAGAVHTFALNSDGKVYAAGDSGYGQLGVGDKKYRNKFVAVSSLNDKKIVAIATGGYHSLALAKDGRLYAAGLNEVGQLGLDDRTDRYQFTEVSSFSGKKIIAIAAEAACSFTFDSDGRLYAAGYNEYGQLGVGDNKDRNKFVAVSSINDKKIIAVAAGDDRSLALASDGKVYTAGRYSYWLGLGDIGRGTNLDKFIEVSTLSGKTITNIAAGSQYSLVVNNDGRVYATGHNRFGQLGLGETGDRNRFVAALSLNGKKAKAIAAGKKRLPAADNDDAAESLEGGTIIAIAAGSVHSLALDSGG
ncbi:MAG: hypothetical protein LBC09_07725, partial [Helicobacteraceae bacterium]|nr:hypothetical protein [Helicobacteraceae bacterium]